MATIAPFGKYRAFDANGAPLSGGKLYTYEAGTSTPKATYTSSTLGTANTNPVILDADGYANVWLDVGGYKFVLDDANDVNQFTVDGIDGGSAVGFASSVVSRSSSFSLGVNEQNVVNICTSPLTVSLLPVATAGNGFTSVIVNLSGGNVTVDPDGSETINNVGSLVIGNGNSLTLSCDGLEWYAFGYTQTELSDSVFRVVDNTDATKKLAFEVSGIGTGTTRTITAASTGITLPANTLTVSADATGPSSIVLAEDTDNGSNTVQIIAPAAVTSNRVLTLPDASGEIISSARLATTAQTGVVQLYAGQVVQSVRGTTTSVITCNTVTPLDNTTPQVTETQAVVTVAITPTNASNLLRITGFASGTGTGAGMQLYPTLFRDSGANAIATAFSAVGGANAPANAIVSASVVAGSTASTTLRFNIGVNTTTYYVNGSNAGAALFNGTSTAWILVEEIQV